MPIAWIASTCTGNPTPATTLGAVSLLRLPTGTVRGETQ